MNKKLLAYALVPVFGLTLGAAGVASAHGFGGMMRRAAPEEFAARQQTMFSEQAALIGVSTDEVKNGWAEGKTLFDLAKEKGIKNEQLQQKMKDARLAEQQTQLKTLVDKGIITQAQADKRLQIMRNREAKIKSGKMGRGFHHGGMFF